MPLTILLPDQPDFGTVKLFAIASTVLPFFNVSGQLRGAPVPFYFQGGNDVECPPNACSGTARLNLFARYGSVRGRVVRPDGTPAVNAVVAAYALDSPGSPLRVAIADATGHYDFAVEDAGFLLNQTREFPSFVFSQNVVTALRENHWGLPVGTFRFEERITAPVRRGYALVAGVQTRSVSAPGQRVAMVESSKAYSVDLISDAETGTCKVPRSRR
jgi:hypothetical protein